MIIRSSRQNDVPAISRIYIKTWQDTYLSLVPFGYLYTMSPDRLEREFVNEVGHEGVISYVAEDGGKVVGFISGGKERHGDPVYTGEIYALYVMKYHQRKGIGTKLLRALASGLSGGRIFSMMVRVLENNPYRRFYEKRNGVLLEKQRMPFAGDMLDIAVYGWIDTGMILKQKTKW